MSQDRDDGDRPQQRLRAGAGALAGRRVLYLEPYDGGSHAVFGRLLMAGVQADWTALTLPGRHWKWHVRAFPAWLQREHAATIAARPVDLVVASSYVNLAEVRGLLPALAEVPALLYFHENQFAYPSADGGAPDFHYGYSQLLSALAAQAVVFNSHYNRDTFLAAARGLLRRMPSPRLSGLVAAVEARSAVLPPLFMVPAYGGDGAPVGEQGPLILWNHRWEHDKGPEAFFAAMEALDAAGLPFRLAVCGGRYAAAPPVFARAEARFASRLVHWGEIAGRDPYVALLQRADVVVSTAKHEFFGVAVMEACAAGAYALVPDRLAYRELYPPAHRYGDAADLVTRLTALCRAYVAGDRLRARHEDVVAPYAMERLLPRYEASLAVVCAGPMGEKRVVESSGN